jgi:hypothetical protein
MAQQELIFNERSGEMQFANARPAPSVAPPSQDPVIVVHPSRADAIASLLGTTRRMCLHLRRDRPSHDNPSQFERGERIVDLIGRLHRKEPVLVKEAVEVESMASVLFLASVRDNQETGEVEYHPLSWHAAEVMDWALRCAIGRQATDGFVAACRRFAEFMRAP